MTGATDMIQQSLATILQNHVVLEVEGIDRMYLNLYVPKLQTPAFAASFFKKHRGARFASSSLMEPMTRTFRSTIDRFVEREHVPIINFKKGIRKDDVAKEHLARFKASEGVLFLGKAQEMARVFRTEKRHHEESGAAYPWIVDSSAMVMSYYFYCVDEDFGPFFIKYCGYFPYNGKVCINGHEWLKRQLAKEGICYEALDNGILSCEDPDRLQRIADRLDANKIYNLVHKWQKKLPFPFTEEDTAAGYQYNLSMLQIEFSLTQVLDRPVTGRLFFEQVIRENLDMGRPDQVQLIFDRRIIKRTPGRFRTRVITEGVTPSLHVDYKHSRIKQYHKEGRALRTETTINNTRDFGIGKGLLNLPALRAIGFTANRRLLDVERLSHDCVVGHEVLQAAQQPKKVDNQRTSGLRFADPDTQLLMQALLICRMHVRGFTNSEFRELLAQMAGTDPANMTQGKMTYLLRKLKLHRVIARIRKTHRYQLTELGVRLCLFYTRAYERLLVPGASHALISDSDAKRGDIHQPRRRDCFEQLANAMDACCRTCQLAA
jgi:hypothetical protein